MTGPHLPPIQDGKTIQTLLDGITLIPRGHVATIKSYLEMRQRPQRPAQEIPNNLILTPVTGKDEARFRCLFYQFGMEWMWFSRLRMSQQELAALLDEPNRYTRIVEREGRDIGIVELDFQPGNDAELSFFGFVKEASRQGLGNALMGMALTELWARNPKRVHINTCTLDDPAALSFYLKWGFRYCAQAVEIIPDPRLDGLLPREAAPHIPILE